MTAIAFARNVDFDYLDQHVARAKENRVRNIFTVEVLRPGSWQWEEVGETGALRSYADAEAVARARIDHQTRARINVRPHVKASITVAEGYAA